MSTIIVNSSNILPHCPLDAFEFMARTLRKTSSCNAPLMNYAKINKLMFRRIIYHGFVMRLCVINEIGEKNPLSHFPLPSTPINISIFRTLRFRIKNINIFHCLAGVMNRIALIFLLCMKILYSVSLDLLIILGASFVSNVMLMMLNDFF